MTSGTAYGMEKVSKLMGTFYQSLNIYTDQPDLQLNKQTVGFAML